MDTYEKKLLAGVYASQLGAVKNAPSDADTKALTEAGLASGGKITDKGRKKIRVVLAGGVFDIIHPGHLHTLEEARGLGDVLVVVVATEKTAEKIKKRKPLHTQVQRRELVASLRMVDACVIGNEDDIFETVRSVGPDVIVLGYDQIHQEKSILDGCAKRGMQVSVARLQSPMPEMSSSKIRSEYDTEIHGL